MRHICVTVANTAAEVSAPRLLHDQARRALLRFTSRLERTRSVQDSDRTGEGCRRCLPAQGAATFMEVKMLLNR